MEEKSFDGFNILKIFGKSFLLEMIVTILGMFILAIVLSKTSLSDSIMGNALIGISSFSIGIGGFLSSRKLQIKGILCGTLQGIIYMGILYLISSIVNHNFNLGIEGIIMIAVRSSFRSHWWNYWCKFKIKKRKSLVKFSKK